MQFLVVDDYVDVCDAVANGLEHYCGVAVTRAGNGASATAILESEPIDLAIIDALLPDISGFELAERAAGRHVPALLMSGHPKQQEACRVHGYPHLDKPFPLSALANAATAVLRSAAENVDLLRQSYAGLKLTRERNERIVGEARQLRIESRRIQAASAQELMRSRVTSRFSEIAGAKSIQHLAVLENIARLQRLLRPDGSNRLDERTERTIQQLLAEEEAILLETESALQ